MAAFLSSKTLNVSLFLLNDEEVLGITYAGINYNYHCK